MTDYKTFRDKRLKDPEIKREYDNMPVRITKVNGYKVTTPGGTKAKHTTRAKAESQARLLRGIEHGWKPRKK